MVQDGPKWIQDDPSRVQHAPTRHQKKGPSGCKRSPRESQDILSSSKMAPRWQPDNPRLSQGVFSVGPCRRKAATTALSERFQETVLPKHASALRNTRKSKPPWRIYHRSGATAYLTPLALRTARRPPLPPLTLIGLAALSVALMVVV